jgi:hypothetical protein
MFLDTSFLFVVISSKDEYHPRVVTARPGPGEVGE